MVDFVQDTFALGRPYVDIVQFVHKCGRTTNWTTLLGTVENSSINQYANSTSITGGNIKHQQCAGVTDHMTAVRNEEGGFIIYFFQTYGTFF